jgi:hypothetical protein
MSVINEALRVEVPAELADELIVEGLEEFVVFRDAASDVATLVSVASASLATGANVATTLVARQAVGHFVTAFARVGPAQATKSD